MARQRLGQHFLKSESILERIAAAVCPTPEPLVVEIGPGRGALTRHLLPRAGRLVAVELDPQLAAHLRLQFLGATIVEADVLETDLGQWGVAAFAGNLPYYISSPILTRLFRLGPRMLRAVVLVQKEVGERLTARPATRDYGYLTVEANLFTVPEMLFRVPPAAFSPPPKVESAAVRLTPCVPPVADPDAFLQFVGRAFLHKRKTLRNNLAPFYGRQVDAWPEARLRAEQVPLDGLIELYQRLGRP